MDFVTPHAFYKKCQDLHYKNFKEVDDENANVPMVEKRSELEVKMKIKNVSLKAEILLRQQPGRDGAASSSSFTMRGSLSQSYYGAAATADTMKQVSTLTIILVIYISSLQGTGVHYLLVVSYNVFIGIFK